VENERGATVPQDSGINADCCPKETPPKNAPELVAHRVYHGVGVLGLKRPDRGRADVGQALGPIDIDGAWATAAVEKRAALRSAGALRRECRSSVRRSALGARRDGRQRPVARPVPVQRLLLLVARRRAQPATAAGRHVRARHSGTPGPGTHPTSAGTPTSAIRSVACRPCAECAPAICHFEDTKVTDLSSALTHEPELVRAPPALRAAHAGSHFIEREERAEALFQLVHVEHLGAATLRAVAVKPVAARQVGKKLGLGVPAHHCGNVPPKLVGYTVLRIPDFCVAYRHHQATSDGRYFIEPGSLV